MLNRIRQFFDQHLAAQPLARNQEHALRLAVGALLLEMTHMDSQRWPQECEAVRRAVQSGFGLDEAASNELIELAQAERAQSIDYFQFTSLINASYTPQQKVQLVETLWRIAYADAELHKYEEHFVRRIADLLYVPHGAFIAAKHRAQGDSEQG
jgi:uncharacterized tellurite resistance protein B-like protein